MCVFECVCVCVCVLVCMCVSVQCNDLRVQKIRPPLFILKRGRVWKNSTTFLSKIIFVKKCIARFALSLSLSSWVVIMSIIFIPVWLPNRLISAGLEPVLSHTKISCIASNYRQFFTNIKIKTIKLILVLSARALGLSGLTKLVLIF